MSTCTVTLLVGRLHEGTHPGVPGPVHPPGRGRGLLLLLVSTSTVQSLYWEVTFMKELTLAGEYLYCTVTLLAGHLHEGAHSCW